MKSVFRAFVAFDLSDEVLVQIDQVLAGLQARMAGLPIRWVPTQNIHLTLKFLGDVSVSNVERLAEILRSAVAGFSVFELSIGGLGVFPNERRPSVLWLGVEGPSALQSIQHRVDVEVARLGYRADERSFAPHLTIGRVARNAGHAEIRQVAEAVQAERVGFLGAAVVREIHLYKSELRPSGAVYAKVYSAPL